MYWGASAIRFLEGEPMANDLDDIADAAEQPKRIKGDAGEVEEHSLESRIAAHKAKQQADAASNRFFGIRARKISQPSAE